MFKRLLASLVCLTFSFSNFQYVHAQDFSVNQLPVPGTMVGVSQPFAPLALKGLIVNPKKPLEFQFIVDTGKGSQDTASIKDQANQLVKYFLAGLTIPEGDLWVNLSPYEKNRMVPAALGQTDLGRDLLSQDYILKQLTASLIYPEKDLGKEFWSRVYAKAQQQFGTTNVPVNTFNKVWILPDQAQVFENVNAAYVTKSTLKVMLDEDYLALKKHTVISNGTNSIGSNIVRQIILPEIEKEVNTGKNFAPLRQIYQALILAKWYKETIQNGLLDALYTNKDKIAGVNLSDPAVKKQIYNRYLQAYKKGAFNYIKEDPTPDGQVVPRKYFSGGLIWTMNVDKTGKQSDIKGPDGAMISLTVGLVAAGAAVIAAAAGYNVLKESKFQKLKEQYPEIYERLLEKFRFGSHFRYDDPEEDAKKFLPKAVAIIKKGKDFDVEISGGTWHWEEQPPQYTGTYEGAYPQQVQVNDNEPLVIRLIEKDQAMSETPKEQGPKDAAMVQSENEIALNLQLFHPSPDVLEQWLQKEVVSYSRHNLEVVENLSGVNMYSRFGTKMTKEEYWHEGDVQNITTIIVDLGNGNKMGVVFDASMLNQMPNHLSDAELALLRESDEINGFISKRVRNDERIKKQIIQIETALGNANEAQQKAGQVIAYLDEKPSNFKGEEVHVLSDTTEKGKVIGRVDRKIAEKFGYAHETANVVMLAPNGDVVLQLRNKENYDDHLSVYGGHLEVGESHTSSALEEAKQETGLIEGFKLPMYFIGPESYDEKGDNNRERRSWFIQRLTQDEWEKMKSYKAQDEKAIGASKLTDDRVTYKQKLAQLWSQGKGEVTGVYPVSMYNIEKALQKENPESKLSDKNNRYLPVTDSFNGKAETKEDFFTPDSLDRLVKNPVLWDNIKTIVQVEYQNRLAGPGTDSDTYQNRPGYRELRNKYQAILNFQDQAMNVPELLKVLSATYLNLKEREAAADELSKIGDKTAIQGLIKVIESGWHMSADGSQGFAPNALVKIGRPALPALIEEVKRKNLATFTPIIGILGKIRDKIAVPVLLEALKDEDLSADYRTSVAEALGNIGDKTAIPGLLEVLKIDDRFIADVVARKLKNNGWLSFKEKEKINILKTWKIHYTFLAKSAAEALKKLGWLPQTEEEKILLGNVYIAALAIYDKEVVNNAANKLVDLEDKRAVEPLLGVLNDNLRGGSSFSSVEQALVKLGASKKQMVDVYIAALSPGYHSRNDAAKKLGDLRDKRATEPLLKLTEEGYYSAAEAILKIGGYENEDILKKFLDWHQQHPSGTYGNILSFLNEAIKYKLNGHDFKIIYEPATSHQVYGRIGEYEDGWYDEVDPTTEVLRIEPVDRAMLETPNVILKVNPAENGGIDLNQINVLRKGKTVNVQFDPAQLNQLEQGGFEGFAPIITGFQYIKSPFPLLGINTAK